MVWTHLSWHEGGGLHAQLNVLRAHGLLLHAHLVATDRLSLLVLLPPGAQADFVGLLGILVDVLEVALVGILEVGEALHLVEEVSLLLLLGVLQVLREEHLALHLHLTRLAWDEVVVVAPHVVLNKLFRVWIHPLEVLSCQHALHLLLLQEVVHAAVELVSSVVAQSHEVVSLEVEILLLVIQIQCIVELHLEFVQIKVVSLLIKDIHLLILSLPVVARIVVLVWVELSKLVVEVGVLRLEVHLHLLVFEHVLVVLHHLLLLIVLLLLVHHELLEHSGHWVAVDIHHGVGLAHKVVVIHLHVATVKLLAHLLLELVEACLVGHLVHFIPNVLV